jgi:hypothetical protein
MRSRVRTVKRDWARALGGGVLASVAVALLTVPLRSP